MAFPAHLFPPRVSNGNGGVINKIEREVKKLGTVKFVALTAVVVLGVEHVIAPKGTSVASKLLHKVLPGKLGLPAIPPPGVVPAAVAKGYFAGANNQAGWLRGMSPYGGMDGFFWHGHGGPWGGYNNYQPYSWE